MANSILGSSSPATAPQGGSPMQGFNPGMLNQLKQFKSSFKGNAKQQVMQMVQQGLRSNEQLQQAMQMAQQFKGFF